MRDAKCGMWNVGYWKRDAGCGMRGAGCKMRDARCRILDAGCGMRDTGSRMPKIIIGITGLSKNLGRDDRIEERSLYGNP